MGKSSIIAEIWEFLRVRKKFLLMPIVMNLVRMGAVIIFAEGSAVAPYIYALF